MTSLKFYEVAIIPIDVLFSNHSRLHVYNILKAIINYFFQQELKKAAKHV